ncbi:carbohydrate ABC transporter permease [Saccharopolyspora sp. 5N708]|uniref:carbohydrate ABC transporter permease n=1 Tax=Saccharopolyspora sp. 5N708 TaxID=3457424 RepID=UPI003FD39F7D
MTTTDFAVRRAPSAAPADQHRSRQTLAKWAFLVPAIVYIAAFFGYPLVNNVVMSFQHYTASTFWTGESPFIGWANWRAVFGDEVFRRALINTALFTAGSLLGQFTIGLALALFFRRRFPLGGPLRSLLLLPWLVPLVAAGTVWRQLLDQEGGAVNEFLHGVGVISQNVPWLSSPQIALLSIILVNIWIGIPFNMVILYGGLQEIPADLYEAASIDGAGRWRTFTAITWPMLRPVVAVVLLLGFIATVKVLDIILVLTGGGPANSTESLSTQVYVNSFLQLDFGRGAVIGNVLMGACLVFAVIYLRANRNADVR